MSTSVFDSVLLKNLWSTEEMRQVFSDNVRMQMWLDYEAALAVEQAKMGIIPQEAADEIVACAKLDRLDMDFILEQVRLTKHPLVPTIRGLEHACSNGFGEYVHFGPTTQDVMDTGMVLQFKMAHKIILRDLQDIGRSLLKLSEEHRNTPMAGRTLALQAIPITFGHKTAIWLAELMRHHERLIQLEPRLFVGSVVGAVGTKASFGEQADELEKRVLDRLGLGTPEISWQPARDRFCEYGMVLGMVSATLGKIANEILLLAHNELDEVAEPFGKGQAWLFNHAAQAQSGDYRKRCLREQHAEGQRFHSSRSDETPARTRRRYLEDGMESDAGNLSDAFCHSGQHEVHSVWPAREERQNA